MAWEVALYCCNIEEHQVVKVEEYSVFMPYNRNQPLDKLHYYPGLQKKTSAGKNKVQRISPDWTRIQPL